MLRSPHEAEGHKGKARSATQLTFVGLEKTITRRRGTGNTACGCRVFLYLSQTRVIQITDRRWPVCDSYASSVACNMERESIVIAISKLAVAGEQAGFSLEQMIQLLDSGLTVESLIELIAWRFEHGKPMSVPSGWTA